MKMDDRQKMLFLVATVFRAAAIAAGDLANAGGAKAAFNYAEEQLKEAEARGIEINDLP